MATLAASGEKAPHPFRIANFRWYWLARISNTIGSGGLTLLIGWQIYDLARQTHSIRESAFILGMIGVAQFVPLFLLTPITGLVADSFDRRWIARVTVALLLIVCMTLGLLTYMGTLTVPIVFVAAVLLGVARAFSGPAQSALAPNLVPIESLPTAIAISAIAWQVGTIVGPSLTGLLFAIHPDVAYGTSSLLLAIAVVCFSMIGRVPQPPRQKHRAPLQRVRDGFAYVRANRVVLGAITLDLFAVILAGTSALLPVFARDILHVGPVGFGLLAAGMGIGAAGAALLFSFRPLRHNVGIKMLGAVVLYGAAIATFGLSKSFLLSVAALIVAGAADMVSVYVRSSLVQLHTPDEMRGRVGAVSQLTISASNELGEGESGLLASLIGPVGAVLFGGVGAIAIALLWARLFPELRLAKTFDPPDMEGTAQSPPRS